MSDPCRADYFRYRGKANSAYNGTPQWHPLVFLCLDVCAYPGGIHAVKRAGGQSTCYDANGNELTSWNYTKGRTRSFTWTSANLVKTITENAQTQTFWYDASGNRFKETNTFNGETALLLGNYLIATTGPAGPKS